MWRSEAEIEQRRNGTGATAAIGGGGGHHVPGRRLRAQASIDAADQEDVPTAHVRAPGRVVADPNATAREPVAAARHPRLAQQQRGFADRRR